MRREDLRAIEGMTPEMVDAVMQLAGQDRTAANTREEQLRTQLEAAQSAQTAAQQQVTTLQTQLNAQQSEYRLRDLIRAAASGAGAYDEDDVIGALLNDDSIKTAQDQATAINAAVEQLKSGKPHWFRQTPAAPEQDEQPAEPAQQSRKVVVPKPVSAGKTEEDPTVQDFAMMDYLARMRLKATNPTLYAALCEALRKAARK